MSHANELLRSGAHLGCGISIAAPHGSIDGVEVSVVAAEINEAIDNGG
jgi:hypothetical protein